MIHSVFWMTREFAVETLWVKGGSETELVSGHIISVRSSSEQRHREEMCVRVCEWLVVLECEHVCIHMSEFAFTANV